MLRTQQLMRMTMWQRREEKRGSSGDAERSSAGAATVDKLLHPAVAAVDVLVAW